MHHLWHTRSLWTFVALAAVCSWAGPGRAGANLIVNGGFEDPVLAPGAATVFASGQTLPVPGGAWIVVGDPGTGIYLLQDSYAEGFNNVSRFNALEGLNSVDLSGPSNIGSSAGVRQVVPVTGGVSYQLSFDVGRVTPAGGPGGVYPSAATVDVSIDGGARVSFTNTDITPDRINWRHFTWTFTPAGNTTSLTLLNGTPVGSNETGLDNVALIPSSEASVGDAPGPMILDLAAPSPNPSRGATSLNYTLSRGGRVRLALYDVSGRLVRVLRDEEQSAGRHGASVPLHDAAGWPLVSGIYLVRLEAGGRQITRRLATFR